MGVVHRARDPFLDRAVALKTVSPAVLTRRDSIERFKREARAAARLQHPHIVTIYELGEVDGRPFIAMELLEGMDMAAALKQRDRYSSSQLLKMTADICHALDYAHKNGVVHRDVKPANVRVQRDGNVKLVDFGIARLADSHLTQTGTVLGTPLYTAPEVLRSGRVDHRSDMWSAGVILYEVLAGHRPFQGDSVGAVALQVVSKPMPDLDASVPGRLVEVVERALRKAPAERFQDLAEMAMALELAAGLSAPVQSAVSHDERARQSASNLRRAQELFLQANLEEALEAARRAQALEPSRTDILALIDDIESHLDQEVGGPEDSGPVPSIEVSATELMTHVDQKAARVVRPDSLGLLERLAKQGAAAFRDFGIFGEPRAAQIACLSPTRDVLAISGSDGAIRIWDLASRSCALVLRTEMHQRTGHEAVAPTLTYAADGKLLASGHVDGWARLWNPETGEMHAQALKHDGAVRALAFSPDGKVLASGSIDSSLRFWQVEAALNGQALRDLMRQPAAITALAYSPDGTHLVSSHSNRVLRAVDPRTRRLTATLRGPADLVSHLFFHGQDLFVVSRDKTLRVFDIGTRNEVRSLQLGRLANSVSVLDGGRVLAVVSQDHAVRLYDSRAGREIVALWGGSGESFASVTSFGRGRGLAVALADGRIRMWEVSV